MIVCCEQCGHRFEVPSVQLTEKGSIVLCTQCQHPHQVFRKVVPFKVLGVSEDHHVRQWNPQATVTVHAEAEESELEAAEAQAAPHPPDSAPAAASSYGGKALKYMLGGFVLALILVAVLVLIGSLRSGIKRQAEEQAPKVINPIQEN